MPVPVARHHSASAAGTSPTEKKPLALRSSQTGSPGSSATSRGVSGPSGHGDEVELVRLRPGRIDERIRAAEHRLGRAFGRRQRDAAELPGDERHLRGVDLQRKQPVGPAMLAGDPCRNPFLHREVFPWLGKIAIMPSPTNPALRRGEQVHVRAPRADDAKAFLAAVRASRALHAGWVSPPATHAAFAAYLARFRPPPRGTGEARHAGVLVARNPTARSSACSTSAKSSAARSRARTSATMRSNPTPARATCAKAWRWRSSTRSAR